VNPACGLEPAPQARGPVMGFQSTPATVVKTAACGRRATAKPSSAKPDECAVRQHCLRSATWRS